MSLRFSAFAQPSFPRNQSHGEIATLFADQPHQRTGVGDGKLYSARQKTINMMYRENIEYGPILRCYTYII